MHFSVWHKEAKGLYEKWKYYYLKTVKLYSLKKKKDSSVVPVSLKKYQANR